MGTGSLSNPVKIKVRSGLGSHNHKVPISLFFAFALRPFESIVGEQRNSA